MGVAEEKEFPAFDIKERQNYLILGNRFVHKRTLDDTTPFDCAIYAYRGSTTYHGGKSKTIRKKNKSKKDQAFVGRLVPIVLSNTKKCEKNSDEYVALVKNYDDFSKSVGFVNCEVTS